MCMFIHMYIYKSEYKYLWSKEISVKVFPVVSVAVNEIFVHMGTLLSSRWLCASAMARIPWFTDFIPAKTKGQSNEVYVLHILQLLLLYNILTTYTYLYPVH
jgi:hypothetical protein